MERRRNPVRRAGLVGLAILALGGLSACGGEGPVGTRPAATVEGHDISPKRVLDLSEAYDRYYRAKKAEKGVPATDDLDRAIAEAAGSGAGTYGASQASQSLRELIRYEVVMADLRRRDAVPTAEEIKTAKAAVQSDILDTLKQSMSEDDAATAAKSVNADLLAYQARFRAATDKLASFAKVAPKVYTDAEQADRAQELYQQAAAQTPYCLSFAFAVDKAAADQNKARVDGGESFADVAAQTINPSSGGPGGETQCGSADDIASLTGEDPTTVEAGDLFGPIDLTAQGAGFLLVHVEGITGPTQSSLQQAIEQELARRDKEDLDAAKSAKVGDAVQKLERKADVFVDPRYGTWDGDAGTLEAPEVPGTTTTSTTVPGAVAVEPAGS